MRPSAQLETQHAMTASKTGDSEGMEKSGWGSPSGHLNTSERDDESAHLASHRPGEFESIPVQPCEPRKKVMVGQTSF